MTLFGKKSKAPNRYECSNGIFVTQAEIDVKRRASHKVMLRIYGESPMCQACGTDPAVDPDHTIAQARCKVIVKTELIWDVDNQVPSCRDCHHQWEKFKNLAWLDHKNVKERLAYCLEHDPEGFRERVILSEADQDERYKKLKLTEL